MIEIANGFLRWGDCSIKVGAVLLLVYGAAALGLCWYGRENGLFACRWPDYQDLSLEKRRQLLIQGSAYLLLSLAWFFQRTGAGEKTALVKAAESALRYEALIVLVLVALELAAPLVRQNPWQYLTQIHRAGRAALFIFVLCTQLAAQVYPWRWDNAVLFLVLGLEFIGLGWLELQPPGGGDASPGQNALDPLSDYNQLFSRYQDMADILVRWISQSQDPSLSICVSGKWGIGKTSVVRGAVSRLREMPQCRGYEYIWVNALELDTLSSLYTHVFSQIKACLKRRGVYVGVGSAYRKFITSSLGVITHDSFAALLESRLFPAAEDYRAQKAELEALLRQAMGSDRIVVVVDDIERCGREKAMQFIFFMKEIATMDRCVSIFLTDYDHLPQDVAPDAYLFYDKFFQRRLDMTEVSLEEAMADIEKSGTALQPLYPAGRRPSQVFRELDERWSERIRNYDALRKRRLILKGEAALYRQFQLLLSLPRNLRRVYAALEDDTAGLRIWYQGKPERELGDYFQKIHLDELLFFLAFLDVCLPHVHKYLRDEGWPELEDYGAEDADKAVLVAWWRLLFMRFTSPARVDPLVPISPYHQAAMTRFIKYFLEDQRQLPRIVNGYSTQEEEWFAAIDKPDKRIAWDEIEDDWPKIANAVLENFSEKDLETGRRYMQTLLRALRRHDPDRSTDCLLSFFRQSDYLLGGKLTVMEDICNTLGTLDSLRPLRSGESTDWINIKDKYLPRRIRPLWGLLHYLEVPDSADHRLLSGAMEMLASIRPAEDALQKFMDTVCQLSLLRTGPLRLRPHGKAIAQLQALVKILERFFEQNQLLVYPDIDDLLKSVSTDIADLSYFFQLEAVLTRQRREANTKLSKVTAESIDSAITHVRRELESPANPSGGSAEELLQDIADQIQSHPDQVDLSDSQVQEIQDLITLFYTRTGRAPVLFRKALLDYQAWKNRQQP